VLLKRWRLKSPVVVAIFPREKRAFLSFNLRRLGGFLGKENGVNVWQDTVKGIEETVRCCRDVMQNPSPK
jgi:hypothetical protein